MVDGLLKLLVGDGLVAKDWPYRGMLASRDDAEEVVGVIVVEDGLRARLSRRGSSSGSARAGSSSGAALAVC